MKGNTSIQAYFPPTPNPSPTKSTASAPSDPSTGDGFTAEEVREALKPRPAEPWHPAVEYADCEIRDLYPGPRAVSFMGRISNVFDVTNTPKTPRSAKGCVKLCVKDDTGAVTVSPTHLRLIARVLAELITCRRSGCGTQIVSQI